MPDFVPDPPIAIEGLPAQVGATVVVQGWVTGVRSSGKIAFVQLRDGSGFVQAVAVRAEVGEDAFERAVHLAQESAVRVRGEVREDARAPSGVEMALADVEVVSPGGDYPITPKEHGVDFLFERRHLHLRHRAPWAILRIRDTVERAVHDFFGERGFVRFDSPLFMPTAVEGTTNLFEIDLFGEDTAYLAQSGQLYAEAGALALGRVYTFGPTFRAEKSKTRRHLLEFWMVEPEVAWLEHDGNVALQEALVAYLVRRVLDERHTELAMLDRDPARLAPTAEGGFPRLSYDEAFDRPVVIEAWPTKTKAFYMQPLDGDPDRVACNDVIAPEGYGEIIGGSQRIHDLALLEERIAAHDLPRDAFAWYLDLRRHGSVPHSGFGMGLERLLAWIVGVPHLREVMPFPRMLTRLYP